MNLLVGVCLSLLVSCDRDAPKQPPDGPDSAAVEPGTDPDAGVQPSTEVRSTSLLSLLGRCDVYHRGAFVDLAGRGIEARREFSIGPFADTVMVDRGGTRVARLNTAKVTYDFWLDAELEEPFIELRGAAGSVSKVGIYLDDRYIATLKLDADLGITRTRVQTDALAPGRHTVTLNLRGKQSAQGRMDLDWLRLGADDDIKATFTPLREEDFVRDVAIDGAPRRTFALPAPSAVRCPLWVPPGASFNVHLGFWGTGKGDAELRLLEDGKQPMVLQRRKVSGGPGSSWVAVHVDLKDYAGRLVAIEMRAAAGVSSGRLAFGDPELELGAVEGRALTPETRTAIVIVMSGVDRRRVPPYAPPRNLPGFAEMMRAGVTYTSYRIPTTVGSGVMASLLTGLAPRAHGLENPMGAVPERVRSIAEVLKQASGRTAMFTGVPTSFKAFGFDRGWDHFEQLSPVSDVGAAQPLISATEWLEKQLSGRSRKLLLVHLRGAHPPWDVGTAEVAQLPPQEYGGMLRARRGALILHDVRARRRPSTRKLASEDWVRLHALHDASLEKQDAELVKLFALLRKRGVYEESLIVLMGDLPLGDPPEVPYDPAAPLREDRLLAPLYIKFPQGELSGTLASAPTTTMDVTTSLYSALGIKPLSHLDGIDLFATARGIEPPLGRPLEATLGNDYAARWGLLLLAGRLGQRPRLCELDVDPACVSDAFDARPIAARALWRAAHALETEARRVNKGAAAAELDRDTTAALTVWGY